MTTNAERYARIKPLPGWEARAAASLESDLNADGIMAAIVAAMEDLPADATEEDRLHFVFGAAYGAGFLIGEARS
jgi:hypothetical protein